MTKGVLYRAFGIAQHSAVSLCFGKTDCASDIVSSALANVTDVHLNRQTFEFDCGIRAIYSAGSSSRSGTRTRTRTIINRNQKYDSYNNRSKANKICFFRLELLTSADQLLFQSSWRAFSIFFFSLDFRWRCPRQRCTPAIRSSVEAFAYLLPVKNQLPLPWNWQTLQ